MSSQAISFPSQALPLVNKHKTPLIATIASVAAVAILTGLAITVYKDFSASSMNKKVLDYMDALNDYFKKEDYSACLATLKDLEAENKTVFQKVMTLSDESHPSLLHGFIELSKDKHEIFDTDKLGYFDKCLDFIIENRKDFDCPGYVKRNGGDDPVAVPVKISPLLFAIEYGAHDVLIKMLEKDPKLLKDPNGCLVEEIKTIIEVDNEDLVNDKGRAQKVLDAASQKGCALTPEDYMLAYAAFWDCQAEVFGSLKYLSVCNSYLEDNKTQMSMDLLNVLIYDLSTDDEDRKALEVFYQNTKSYIEKLPLQNCNLSFNTFWPALQFCYKEKDNDIKWITFIQGTLNAFCSDNEFKHCFEVLSKLKQNGQLLDRINRKKHGWTNDEIGDYPIEESLNAKNRSGEIKDTEFLDRCLQIFEDRNRDLPEEDLEWWEKD